MTIPLFSVIPSAMNPATFSSDFDQWLSEVNAWTNAVNAAGSAYGASITTTSTSSVLIGTGDKTFTVAAGGGFVPGMEVFVARTSATANRMGGTVVSYAGTSLVISVTAVGGAGTFADWTIGPATIGAVTLDGPQTLTNKTLTDPVMTNPLTGAGGGTGINNGARTLSYAGNVAFTGAYNIGFVSPGAYTYTLPGLSAIVATEQLQQVSKSVAYTCVLADAGKHLLHPSADTTARVFTIPANASVAYPIGTAITFVNQAAAGVVTIAITTDTMRQALTGTTGSRTLAANGIATALKITATEWIISGTGLT